MSMVSYETSCNLAIRTSGSETQSGLLLGDVGDETASDGLRQRLCAGKLGGEGDPGEGNSPGKGSECSEAGTRKDRCHCEGW